MQDENGAEVFNTNLNIKDILLYCFTSENKDATLLSQIELRSITSTQCQLEVYSVPETVEGFTLFINPSASLQGNMLTGYTKSLTRMNNMTNAISTEDIAKIKEALGDKGIIDSVFTWTTRINSVYSAVNTVLKMVGIMEDPTQSALVNIQKSLTNLSGQITALSSQMKSIYGRLNEKLNKISKDVQKTLFTTKEIVWTDFVNAYINNGIGADVQSFKNLFVDSYIGFSSLNNYDFSLYYDTKGNLTYPVTTYHEEGTEWKSIDNTDIDSSKTITFTVTSSLFPRTNGLQQKKMDDSNYKDALNADLKDILKTVDGVTDSNVDKYLEDTLCSLENYSVRKAFNTKQSDGVTLANHIINDFTSYCSALMSNVSNPLEAYRYIITANYNFQSEAKVDLDAFNDYIAVQTEAFRVYVDLADKLADVTNESVKSAIDTKDTLLEYLKVNTGFRAERPGCQYSYVTSGYVKAQQYRAFLNMSVTVEVVDHLFYYTGIYRYGSFSLEWTNKYSGIGNKPGNLISTNQLQAMNAIYQTRKDLECEKANNFGDYFKNNLVYIQDSYTQSQYLDSNVILCGDALQFNDFNVDGSHRLTCYSEVFSDGISALHPIDYFRKGKTYAIGTESDGKAESQYYMSHKSLKGDVMNMDTGLVYEDEDLLSGAIYNEDHGSWRVAEIALFAGHSSLFKDGTWKISYSYSSGNLDSAGTKTYHLQAFANFWAITNV